MKALMVSVFNLLLIIGLWFGFMTYCENSLASLTRCLNDEISVKIEEEDWTGAQKGFDDLCDTWHHNKQYYSYFLKTAPMLEADFSLAKVAAYIKARDASAAQGELSYIEEQLRFLVLDEKITLENIL